MHELTHQWFGDSLAVARLAHIWLNEGFATYAEWLWSEHEGLGTAQENFDFWYEVVRGRRPVLDVLIGDPGPDLLFDFAVYIRGGMTLHQLRLAVGDDAFFEIMQPWAAHAGGNVTTSEFIALAETISGQDLGALFETWLFTRASRPWHRRRCCARPLGHSSLRHAPVAAQSLYQRYGHEDEADRERVAPGRRVDPGFEWPARGGSAILRPECLAAAPTA